LRQQQLQTQAYDTVRSEPSHPLPLLLLLLLPPTGSNLTPLGDEAPGVAASLSFPLSVAWHQKYLYIADTLHNRVRR
jgi:hypothetical protein